MSSPGLQKWARPRRPQPSAALRTAGPRRRRGHGPSRASLSLASTPTPYNKRTTMATSDGGETKPFPDECQKGADTTRKQKRWSDWLAIDCLINETNKSTINVVNLKCCVAVKVVLVCRPCSLYQFGRHLGCGLIVVQKRAQKNDGYKKKIQIFQGNNAQGAVTTHKKRVKQKGRLQKIFPAGAFPKDNERSRCTKRNPHSTITVTKNIHNFFWCMPKERVQCTQQSAAQKAASKKKSRFPGYVRLAVTRRQETRK